MPAAVVLLVALSSALVPVLAAVAVVACSPRPAVPPDPCREARNRLAACGDGLWRFAAEAREENASLRASAEALLAAHRALRAARDV